ncbi:hypothetical protein CQW23_20292 [Capsicum baccatum]|uniref:Uncharacterized protein n=1 Tax=Capsicum baccatum TaxID=33114 RepID=A0A2G2W883_CAPBA|nr:hypothetical protein CQW23_20292 [Capsicum baccatum]
MMHFGIETVGDKNWFNTMGFPDQSWTDSRKKPKYDPNRSYKFITVDCNFMNIIRSVHDVYSADAANLTGEGQMVTYAECLSYGHKVLANKFDPNTLRTRYAALLWEYGTKKQDTNAQSDVESPLRPARQSRITSVTEVFDV